MKKQSHIKRGFTLTPTLVSLLLVCVQTYFKCIFLQRNNVQISIAQRRVVPRPKLVSGFTLIELLVVIAIIGMLSSIVLASLNSARSKGRDARRLSDMDQIHTALELYYDKYGKYPDSTLSGTSCWWLWASGNAGGGGTFLPELAAEGFMPSVPKETWWAAATGWSGCNYRYVRFNTTNTSCGAAGNYAVLYSLMENPTPASCHNACTPGWGWGEGGPTDTNGCVLILRE